jgi:hypothetical protein
VHQSPAKPAVGCAARSQEKSRRGSWSQDTVLWCASQERHWPPRPIEPVSTSHAAWDVDAVHGVHAMYSVRSLGTARLAAAQIRLGASAIDLVLDSNSHHLELPGSMRELPGDRRRRLIKSGTIVTSRKREVRQWVRSSRSAASGWRRRSIASCSSAHGSSAAARASSLPDWRP